MGFEKLVDMEEARNLALAVLSQKMDSEADPLVSEIFTGHGIVIAS